MKRRLALRIFLILLMCVADITWAAWITYHRSAEGTMIPAKFASGDPLGFVLQCILLAVVPILLFGVMLFVLKKRFASELFLRLSGRKQWLLAGLLAAALLGMTVAALIVKTDRVAVLLSLFYYTFLIAFSEEFVIRGVCVWLLKDESTLLRYVLPNLLFAAMHFFAFANWGSITPDYVLYFLTRDFLGLAAGGCLFQLLKEKTGTLWVPILLHAMMDFSVVFSY